MSEIVNERIEDLDLGLVVLLLFKNKVSKVY